MLQKLSGFTRNIWITVALVLLLAAVFAQYTLLERQVDSSNDLRLQSLLLADELRQSSDDLTRMVRTYVVTGNPVYKQHYQDILDIRNGKKPRPQKYQGIYWDFMVAEGQAPPPSSSETIALLDLIRRAGCTQEELDKLALAKGQSEDLTRAEFEAMRLVEAPSLQAGENQAKALSILHDEAYHQAKAKIMRPIGEFYDLVNQRTALAVQNAQATANQWRIAFIAIGLALIAFMARSMLALRNTLGGSIDEVKAQMARIGQGDFVTPLALENAAPDSVLAGLAQTQRNLYRIDQERQSAQMARLDALRESQTLMDAINMYSIVSISDPAGKIIFANEMFSEISGYSNEELIGQNHRLVKSTVQSDSYWNAMWKTISSGYPWRDTICNRAKDGTPYWVDTVIAPFFGDHGIEKYISVRTNITPIKLAQQKLDAERSRLNNIITGTRAGTWEWNLQTDESTVNARWAELIGHSLQDWGEKPVTQWRKLMHPDDQPAVEQALQKHLSGESDVFEFEGRVRHNDGHWVWQLCRGKLFNQSPDDQPEWMYGIVLDISASKQAEVALKESAASLRDNAAFLARAGRIAGIGRWQLDLLHDTMDWSDQTCQIHDVASGFQPTLQQSIDFFAPEAKDNIQNAIDAAMRTGRPWDLELPLITAMNRRIWVRSAGEAEYQDGKRIRLVGIFQDISQRRKLEDEVRQKNMVMQTILTNLPVGLSVFDSQLNLMIDNKLFRTLLDLPDSLFEGEHTPFESIIRYNAERGEYGDTDREASIQSIVDRARLARPHHFQRERADGRTLEIRGAPMPNGGFVTTYADVTDLARATRAAQEASRSKSQFVANMSHEIRTPMNAILGMLQLLHNTELSTRQLDYTAKAQGAAKSLLGLLNDVLDFSKMEAAKMTLDPQPFQLDRLMRDLAVILSANVGNKPVEVLFDLDPAIPDVMIGDAMRLQQILINLGGNAIKFTSAGQVVVQIKVVSQTPTDVTLRIAVIDSGIGIAAENQAHIFDGFSQAEASTTRRFGGTGLGLSICKRLAQLMGSDLSLSSEPNQGSTFHFTLTLPIALAQANTTEPTPTIVARETKPIHILVVDDNAVARDVLGDMASALGWQVSVVDSGAAALDILQTRQANAAPPFDAILVDWHMPQMDGWQTIDHIRQLPHSTHTPLTIMVTAHGREMLTQRSALEQSYLSAFLVKPITASMLYETITDAREGVSNMRTKPRNHAGIGGRLAGLRLLVVEDNHINQQVAQELLAAEGAVVELADNGQLGVDAVTGASVPYDAVLMDLQMPLMDGYAATRKIRLELGLTQLPIIAMTANAMVSDREACAAAGMNDHVGKPFDINHLVAVLCNHLRRPTASNGTESIATPTNPMTGEPDAIDTVGALQRMGGKVALYAQVVQSYLNEIDALPGQLDALLQQGDHDGGARLLHTLKGLSATVGATQMASTARTLEQALKVAKDRPIPSETLVNFREAIGRTQEAMQQVLAHFAPDAMAPAPFSPHSPLTPEQQAALVNGLGDLHALLKSSDMRAIDLHAQLLQSYALHTHPKFDAVNKSVNAFNFSQGAEECEKLVNELSQPHLPSE